MPLSNSKNKNIKIFIEVLERFGNVFAIYDQDYRLIFANKAAYEALPKYYEALEKGLSIQDATRRQIIFSAPQLSPDDVRKATTWYLKRQASGEQYETNGSDGRILTVTHERIDKHTILGLGIDTSEHKKQQEKLKALAAQNFILANTDQLTNLANRRRFIEILEDLMVRAKSEDTSFHIGLLDLNGFKRINDIYGHAVGDQLLKTVAKRMKKFINDKNGLARLGGDEFAIIYKEGANTDQLRSFSQSLFDIISQPNELAGNQIEVHASLGWSHFPTDGRSVSDLLRKSDYALYQSKSLKTDQAVVFTTEHENIIRQQSKICVQLENADLENELFLEFQPIHNTGNGTILAFEALARWNNEKLGILQPNDFIPLAERIGCISTLTKTLLNKALHTASLWPKNISLHFNLSGVDLGKTSLIEELIEITRESGFPLTSLVFEITETAMVDNFDGIADIFNIFDSAGVRIALDDFGIGYSNLIYLTRIPVKSLKIDKSFTENLRPQTHEETILKTMQFLCQNMGIKCIVEGVERLAQYELLKSLGLETMQGYYFTEPLSATDLPAYILNTVIKRSDLDDLGHSLIDRFETLRIRPR